MPPSAFSHLSTKRTRDLIFCATYFAFFSLPRLIRLCFSIPGRFQEGAFFRTPLANSLPKIGVMTPAAVPRLCAQSIDTLFPFFTLAASGLSPPVVSLEFSGSRFSNRLPPLSPRAARRQFSLAVWISLRLRSYISSATFVPPPISYHLQAIHSLIQPRLTPAPLSRQPLPILPACHPFGPPSPCRNNDFYFQIIQSCLSKDSFFP